MKRANKEIPIPILMTKYKAITARKPVILYAIVGNELLTMVHAQQPVIINSSRETAGSLGVNNTVGDNPKLKSVTTDSKNRIIPNSD